MATKAQLELHIEQLGETNQRLGDDVVRLTKESHLKILRLERDLKLKTDECDHWLNADIKSGQALERSKTKRKLALKFIKSII